jgi:hypothetical protein
MLPTNRAEHETLEITQGSNDWPKLLRDQQQQFFPALDIDFAPEWEFNFGVGVGTTGSTDHILVNAS